MGVMDTNLVVSHHIDMPPISDDAPATALIADVRLAYGNDWRMTDSLEAGVITRTADHVILSFLMIIPARRRRQGIATRFLRAICASADRHGVVIEADAVALSLRDSTGALTQDELMRFYQKFGFIRDSAKSRRIVRHPASIMETAK